MGNRGSLFVVEATQKIIGAGGRCSGHHCVTVHVACDTEVGTLAAPIGAPWLKIGEAMDFILAVRPRRAFYAHDMTLSVAGKSSHIDRLKWATEQGGGSFHPLEVGESLEV